MTDMTLVVLCEPLAEADVPSEDLLAGVERFALHDLGIGLWSVVAYGEGDIAFEVRAQHCDGWEKFTATLSEMNDYELSFAKQPEAKAEQMAVALEAEAARLRAKAGLEE